MPNPNPSRVRARPKSTLFGILLLWVIFYASFTLFTPPLLDDADSVHAEVAREMLTHNDYVTLHANNIRYLEKAPLLYWSMAASMRVSIFFGASSPRWLAVAARIPGALCILGLALLVEVFARRIFHARRAGLYAALLTLSSFGFFLFTRITIPDAGVCLWTTLALYAFFRTEELEIEPEVEHTPTSRPPPNAADLHKPSARETQLRLYCGLFALACALNVLTKGLIGIVFPLLIVGLYLLLTRGIKRSLQRLRQLHPWATLEAFLLVAAPWHIMAGLANPTEGHPAPFHFIRGSSFPLTLGHWLVPLPTDGNVRGWFWFYFMNEHLLRYLNLRIPHDYDTSPLWLFWGLCFLWLMPFSAFIFKAVSWSTPFFDGSHRAVTFRSQLRRHNLPLKRRGALLLTLWAGIVLLFFALSTRQEYYVLPALPALILLLAGYLAHESRPGQKAVAPAPKHTIPTKKPGSNVYQFGETRASRGFSFKEAPGILIAAVLLLLGTLFGAASLYFLLHSQTPAPNTDLAQLLQQNPADYALSLGHFLDLNAAALGLFRLPLALAAAALFVSTLVAFLFRLRADTHAANLSLITGAFGFLLAAHLGLQTFSPVLSSAQLANAIAPHIGPFDLIVIHGEYEAGSTLGFYLGRPDAPGQEVHILDGRSSNLWYGSFFPDSPPIFETRESLAAKWNGPDRIFLWQSLTDPDPKLSEPPPLPGRVYILVKSGGKEILSNRPNR